MTLKQKLEILKKDYPLIYKVLCHNVPKLVANPSSPSARDLDEYNFWIDSIDEDEAQPLYHLIG